MKQTKKMKKMVAAAVNLVEDCVKMQKSTGVMDVEGTKMKLFERPVKLGKRVSIIDAKTAKEIGYVDVEKVFELLNDEDGRFQAYEDPSTQEFMLAYSSEGVGAMAVVCSVDSLMEYLGVIEANLDTAMGADDPKKLSMGVSYEKKGRKYVTYMGIGAIKGAIKYLDKDVVGVLSTDGAGGPTERLIGVVRKKVAKAVKREGKKG